MCLLSVLIRGLDLALEGELHEHWDPSLSSRHLKQAPTQGGASVCLS